MRTFLTILILLTLGMWGTCAYVSNSSSQAQIKSPLSSIRLVETRLKNIQGKDFFILDVDDLLTPDSLDYHIIFHAPTGKLWFVIYHDSLDWYLWDVADTTVKKVGRRHYE